MRSIAGSGVIGSAPLIGSSGTQLEMCVPDPMNVGAELPGTRLGYPMDFRSKQGIPDRSRAARYPMTCPMRAKSVPRLDCYRSQVRRSAGDGIRRRNRRTWIAFLGGIGLLGAALLASMTRAIPDLITTVAALMGVAGMIYGVATGTLMVFDRRPDDK